MLDRLPPGPALLRDAADQTAGASGPTGRDAMAGYAGDEHDRARRFHDAVLPYLDDAYALARYLLRNAADAEDAVQECFLRAFRHFDSYRGPAMKPWLFAILRNVCRAEYARRATTPVSAIEDVPESAEQAPLWQEAEETPEAQLQHRWGRDT